MPVASVLDQPVPRQLPAGYYGCSRVTKRKTKFADEDLAMACRALWILEGHPPGRDQPPPEFDLARVMSFSGSDGFAVPLAQFAIVREMDSSRAAESATVTAEACDSPIPRIAAAQRRLAAQREACRLEKRANQQLRDGLLRVSNAVKDWRRAAEKRAPAWAVIPPHFLNSKHASILEALVAAQEGMLSALQAMDASMRQLTPQHGIDEYPSTLGLPKAERNESLNEQALNLAEAGVSLEQIAYVMGWDSGTPEQAKDRTRKRLEDARARRDLGAPAG